MQEEAVLEEALAAHPSTEPPAAASSSSHKQPGHMQSFGTCLADSNENFDLSVDEMREFRTSLARICWLLDENDTTNAAGERTVTEPVLDYNAQQQLTEQ